jgi:hypothetical protein
MNIKKTLLGLSLLAVLVLGTVASASHGDDCCGTACCLPTSCAAK